MEWQPIQTAPKGWPSGPLVMVRWEGVDVEQVAYFGRGENWSGPRWNDRRGNALGTPDEWRAMDGGVD